jgi:GR25 family glycosyltransferase involved in LPS biosynthesis
LERLGDKKSCTKLQLYRYTDRHTAGANCLDKKNITSLVMTAMRCTLLVAFFWLATINVCGSEKETCAWHTKDTDPEVYWINMDSSKQRRVTIEKHLNTVGLRNHRIRGLTPKEIYIPPDIESTWRTAWCKVQTDWSPPDKLSDSFNTSSPYLQYSAYMAALCGRGKDKNTPKELGCTTSHLYAMRKAIYSTTAKSRYALIVEDDVYFPFDIDFDMLIQSAPKGFGILQLFNSNQGSMQATWDKYVQNSNYLWIRRHPVKYFDFWSTCAYLIDRVAMRPVVDKVISEVNGWVQFKVIAGINNPCVPRECCQQGPGALSGGDNLHFVVDPPCVWAPRGYQADHFLYAMAPTYMLSVPIISNGLGGNESTFHQSHVEMFHKKSFQRLRGYVNDMLTNKVAPPPFMKPACNQVMDANAL